MSSVNITREEAQQRSQVITAHSSKVLVDLSGRDPNGDPLGEPTETFVSSSTIQFSSTGGQSHLDLIADGVYAADLDGTPLDPAAFSHNRFPFTTEPGTHEITVTALCRFMPRASMVLSSPGFSPVANSTVMWSAAMYSFRSAGACRSFWS